MGTLNISTRAVSVAVLVLLSVTLCSAARALYPVGGYGGFPGGYGGFPGGFGGYGGFPSGFGGGYGGSKDQVANSKDVVLPTTIAQTDTRKAVVSENNEGKDSEGDSVGHEDKDKNEQKGEGEPSTESGPVPKSLKFPGGGGFEGGYGGFPGGYGGFPGGYGGFPGGYGGYGGFGCGYGCVKYEGPAKEGGEIHGETPP